MISRFLRDRRLRRQAIAAARRCEAIRYIVLRREETALHRLGFGRYDSISAYDLPNAPLTMDAMRRVHFRALRRLDRRLCGVTPPAVLIALVAGVPADRCGATPASRLADGCKRTRRGIPRRRDNRRRRLAHERSNGSCDALVSR